MNVRTFFFAFSFPSLPSTQLVVTNLMAKRPRGTRMAAAIKRAAKGTGGKGRVKNRPAGKHIMKT